MSKNIKIMLAIVLVFITTGGAIIYASSVDPNQLSFQQERREVDKFSRVWNGWKPLSSSSIQMIFHVGTPCSKTEIEKITRDGTTLKAVVKSNKGVGCIDMVPKPLKADYVTVRGTEGIETVELYYTDNYNNLEKPRILERIDKSES